MSAAAGTGTFSALYGAYAAGCLDPGFALLVETQAALRTDIHEAIRLSEAIAGAQLELERPADMDSDAVDRALAAIDAAAPEAADLAPPALEAAATGLGELIGLPEPLREAALDAAGDTGWTLAGPGLKRLRLDVSDALDCELYRIEAGARVPRHSHSGTEFTLVVAGGFSDETGHYLPGDISLKGAEDTHTPTADAGGVCLALAVRDGDLRFTGLMGLLQRLTR